MAEIKSTRDLIMERTKGLTMTDEEKKALHIRELRGKVKGLVRKVIDGTLDLGRFQGEMQQENARTPELPSVLFEELLGRIAPEGENGLLFEIMENVLGCDTIPLRELVGSFRRELEEKILEETVKVKRELARRGISGTAVEPNLERDPRWKKDREELKALYVEKIRSAATF